MCEHGTYKRVRLNRARENSGTIVVSVDSCIADEVQYLNDCGVVTLGCCCGHGQTGQVCEWENIHGKFRERYLPPHVLIKRDSVELINSLGYRAYPYYHDDGEDYNDWLVYLKTGCITEDECKEFEKRRAATLL